MEYKLPPSKLAMTEVEAQTVKDSFTLQLLGHWYKLSDIDDILWDNDDGSYSSGVEYPNYATSNYTDADVYYVVLTDGTELEIDLSLTDDDTQEMLYEWIQTM